MEWRADTVIILQYEAILGYIDPTSLTERNP